jgi:four helix bundle protein
MSFKFEKLEVWRRSLDYADIIYDIAAQLPHSEEYNLKSQIVRAATSISLNIAEGSTGQTDAEQARFLGLAIRSLIETVACQHLINRRGFLSDKTNLRQAYRDAQTLMAMLYTMRKTIAPSQSWLRENPVEYVTNGEMVEDDTEVFSDLPSSVTPSQSRLRENPVEYVTNGEMVEDDIEASSDLPSSVSRPPSLEEESHP